MRTRRLVIVIPAAVSAGWQKRARALGFITYPEFLDCRYVPRNGESRDPSPDVDWFISTLRALGRRVKIAVLPDHMHDLWEPLVREFDWIVWIAPIHRMRELEHVPEGSLIGIPARAEWRDYRIHQMAERVDRLWILGVKKSQLDLVLRLENVVGFDTTIPVFSSRSGKVLDEELREVEDRRLSSYEKVLISLRNFARWLRRRGVVLMDAKWLRAHTRS